MREFSVQNCRVKFDPSDNSVSFVGVLIRPTQLDALVDTLQQLRWLINMEMTVRVRIVDCEECVSLLLKPFLLWIRDLVEATAGVHLQVASEEEEVLPWHETIIDRIAHFNKRGVPVEHEEISID